MDFNFKLYFKCLLINQSYSFISNLAQAKKNDNIVLDPKLFYFLALHMRFSSLFYSTSLVDIFSYELASSRSGSLYGQPSTIPTQLMKYLNVNKGMSTITVYNFHVLNTQNRFFLFLPNHTHLFSPSSLASSTSQISSITELFSAANWLERECSELHGISFLGKKDLRNLMLH